VSTGGCDPAEVCNGLTGACPNDALAPLGTTCRAAAGVCDAAETCSGSSAACPPDVKVPVGTTCRASAGPCDVAEACDGTGNTCPADVLASQGTVCAPAGSCQNPGVCSGLAVTCPGPTGCSDTTPPVFTNVPGTIIAYATVPPSSPPPGATVTYTKPTATDAKDGVRAVTCTPASGTFFRLGKTTVKCTASDTKGNTATATFTVWVQVQAPGDGTFFLTPIRSDGKAVFKIGRPIPVRFKLTGASAGITYLDAKFSFTKLSSTVQGTYDVVSDETEADTDTTFKYRPLLKWYAYRWKTSNQTQGTYQLKVDLGDGVTHQINVSLKK
jgi:hypothetical protein